MGISTYNKICTSWNCTINKFAIIWIYRQLNFLFWRLLQCYFRKQITSRHLQDCFFTHWNSIQRVAVFYKNRWVVSSCNLPLHQRSTILDGIPLQKIPEIKRLEGYYRKRIVKYVKGFGWSTPFKNRTFTFFNRLLLYSMLLLFCKYRNSNSLRCREFFIVEKLFRRLWSDSLFCDWEFFILSSSVSFAKSSEDDGVMYDSS